MSGGHRIGRKRSRRFKITDLGENIKHLQEQRGLKHAVLAAQAGIGRNTLTRMTYASPQSPTIDKIQKVADALDVPLWSLFLPPEDRDEP